MMHDPTPRKDKAGYETMRVSRQALKALSEVRGLMSGPLSPLSRIREPQGPARAGELIAAWGELQGAWSWAVPALLDPHCTIAFLCGDGNANMVGQYIFPDAEAFGPGFLVAAQEEELNLAGPLSLGELGIGFHSRLALERADEPPQLRLDLAVEQFRLLAACLDAYRTAALGRRLLRSGGLPAAVGLADILEAWADGTSMLNPGWAVSLFQLLAPAGAPADLAMKLPGLLEGMVRGGYLTQKEDRGSGETAYALSESLSPMLRGLTEALHFGLAVRRLRQPPALEVTIMGGWRTPGGIWLADLSDVEDAGITLILAGPGLAAGIIDEALGDDSLAPPWEEFAMETPYSRDAVVSRLRSEPAGGESAATEAGAAGGRLLSPSFCTRCGQSVRQGTLFCKRCGAPLQRSSGGKPMAEDRKSCPNCGYLCSPGAKYCRDCGTQL